MSTHAAGHSSAAVFFLCFCLSGVCGLGFADSRSYSPSVAFQKEVVEVMVQGIVFRVESSCK